MSKSGCFSIKVDISLANKLENDLIEQGFAISKPPHTLLQGKKKGITCTLYESGSLTVQGKEMGPFIEFYLEPEILKEFRYSHPAALLDYTSRIGMDEAGKGDFFGPLCIAALFADEAQIKKLSELRVKDSKSFSDAAVLKIAQEIRKEFAYTVIRLFPQKYNELYGKFKNLNRLMSWAHASALEDLSKKTGCKKAILDQFAYPELMEKALKQKKLDVELTQKVRGEEDIVVAGASILARAAFLEGLEKLKKEYEIELPKGASSIVKKAGEKIVAKLGKEVLGKIAKVHFKTAAEIVKSDASSP